jgi:hypothetical protein
MQLELKSSNPFIPCRLETFQFQPQKALEDLNDKDVAMKTDLAPVPFPAICYQSVASNTNIASFNQSQHFCVSFTCVGSKHVSPGEHTAFGSLTPLPEVQGTTKAQLYLSTRSYKSV